MYLFYSSNGVATSGANGLVVKYSFAKGISCAGGSIPPWRISFCLDFSRFDIGVFVRL